MLPKSGRDRLEQELRDIQLRVASLSAALSTFQDPQRPGDVSADELLQQMRDGLLVVDPDGRHVWVNPALCAMTGFEPDELLGTKPPHPYWDMERLDEISAAFNEHVLGKSREPFEAPFRRKDGAELPVVLYPSAIRSDDGLVRYFVATVIDSSARKRAERALEESQALEQLTAQISGTLVRFGGAASGEAQILGAMEVIGRFHQIDRVELWWFNEDRSGAFKAAAWARPGVTQSPAEMRLADGSWLVRRVVEGQASIVHDIAELPAAAELDRKGLSRFGVGGLVVIPVDAADALVGWMSFAVDRRTRRWSEPEVAQLRATSELIASAFARRYAIAALQASERRYREVVDDQTEFIVRWKPDGTRTFVNPAYCRCFGLTSEQAIGTSFFPLISEEDRMDVSARIAALTPEQPVSTDDHRVLLPDGTTGWQRWTDRALFNQAGELVELQSVGRDVTAYRIALDQLRAGLERQTLYAELSGRLVAASGEAIDREITICFARVAQMFGMDRIALWWFDTDQQTFVRHHAWSVEPPLPRNRIGPGELKWLREPLLRLERVLVRAADVPEEDAEFKSQLGSSALLLLPFAVGPEAIGVAAFIHPDESLSWTSSRVEQALTVIANLVGAASLRLRAERELELGRHSLKEALAELRVLKDRAEAENVYLREEVRQAHGGGAIIGESAVIRACIERIARVAETDATVLVLGETGTGKELIAREIHQRSTRRQGPLVAINCAALPPNLIEDELFGHERGAFTGAERRHTGRFELAHGGTLFLDEIGEFPLPLQAKVLRVLQEGEVQRVGSHETLRVDVRIVAATNRDLKACVERGEFRSDLYYRLNVYPILVPPLRDRREDISLLAGHFVSKLAPRLAKDVRGISRGLLRRLEAYPWPGNVRELQNFIERALIGARGPVLDVEEGPGELQSKTQLSQRASSAPLTLVDAEARHIREVLEEVDWRVEGPSGAAALLDVPPSTLRSRMRKLGIVRP